MIKIIVSTEKEKEELLEASSRLHDTRDVELDFPMINTICHLNVAPDLIEVDPDLK